jgi:chromosome segregation ATPase
MSSRIKRWLIVLGGVGVAYVALNVALVGGHVLKHRDDRASLKALADQLETERIEIERLEGQLTLLEGSLEQTEVGLGRLGRWIESIESQYPRGIPSIRYEEYTSTVGRYNTMIQDYNETLASYQELQPEYSARIDTFNVHAEEANALAEKIGNVPNALPIDLPRAQPLELAVTNPR